MRRGILLALCIAAGAAAADEDETPPVRSPLEGASAPVRRVDDAAELRAPPPSSNDWATGARFFAGVRLGVGVPPGGTGLAPLQGIELGVSARKGVGFGLHIIAMQNPPKVDALNIAKASWGIGALADLRMYFQTVDPLTLYATLSAGFVAGPGDGGAGNVVLPLLNPGFGARVKVTDSAYIAFEFGLASFIIPFVTLSFGWEPPRTPPRAADAG